MIEPPSKTEILLARIAVALIIGLAVAGVVWYGRNASMRMSLPSASFSRHSRRQPGETR
jgi:hypothetical protein